MVILEQQGSVNGPFERYGSGVLMTSSSLLHYRGIKKVKLLMML